MSVSYVFLKDIWRLDIFLNKPMIFNFYFSVLELICKWILTVLVSIAGSKSTSTWQEGNKKREDGERGSSRGRVAGGGGVTITQSRQLFQIFPFTGGDYLRAVMNRRMTIIWGNTVVNVFVPTTLFNQACYTHVHT